MCIYGCVYVFNTKMNITWLRQCVFSNSLDIIYFDRDGSDECFLHWIVVYYFVANKTYLSSTWQKRSGRMQSSTQSTIGFLELFQVLELIISYWELFLCVQFIIHTYVQLSHHMLKILKWNCNFLLLINHNSPTDQPTNQPMDQPTNKLT